VGQVRAKNVYSGQVDADLHLRNSLATPVVSGQVQLSRGMAYLSQESMGTPSPAGAERQASGAAGKFTHAGDLRLHPRRLYFLAPHYQRRRAEVSRRAGASYPLCRLSLHCFSPTVTPGQLAWLSFRDGGFPNS
jgi:hypothetical protein